MLTKILDFLKRLTPLFKYLLLAAAVFLLCLLLIEARACRRAPEEVEYWKGVAAERAREAGHALADLSIIRTQMEKDKEAYDKAMAEKDGEIDSLYTVLASSNEEKDKAIADKKKALAGAATDREKVKIQAGIILDLEDKVQKMEMTYAEIIAAKDREINIGKVRIHNLEVAQEKYINEVVAPLVAERDALKELNKSLTKALRVEKAKKTVNKPLYALAGYGLGKAYEALKKK